MADIIALPTPAATVQESCVKVLRAALELAERGELTDVIVVAQADGPRTDGRPYYLDWSGSADAMRRIGMLSLVLFDMQHNGYERED